MGKIIGSETISNLPNKNVLFISNHETYFADATAMIHVFNSTLKNQDNYLKNRKYLLEPKTNIYFIAAKETMNAGILPKILAYTGAICISRTWKEKQKKINRAIDINDINNIKKSLQDGWLITFPQGTIKPWAPIRKGTAHIIQDNKPLVIPIVINGFREYFNKTGLKIRNKKIQKTITIKKPLEFDYKNETLEDIIKKISISIEQHSSFNKI